jgi:hypothetical protein
MLVVLRLLDPVAVRTEQLVGACGVGEYLLQEPDDTHLSSFVVAATRHMVDLEGTGIGEATLHASVTELLSAQPAKFEAIVPHSFASTF